MQKEVVLFRQCSYVVNTHQLCKWSLFSYLFLHFKILMRIGWGGLEDVKKHLSGPCFEDHRGLSAKGMAVPSLFLFYPKNRHQSCQCVKCIQTLLIIQWWLKKQWDWEGRESPSEIICNSKSEDKVELHNLQNSLASLVCLRFRTCVHPNGWVFRFSKYID